MREVISGLVWTGNARDAENVTEVLSREIIAVIDLAMEQPPCSFPREIIYCRFPLIDGDGNRPAILKTAILTAATLIDEKTPLLITCSGGMSRSPAIAAAAIAHANNESAAEWLKKISAIGPHDVSPSLWNEVQECIRKV